MPFGLRVLFHPNEPQGAVDHKMEPRGRVVVFACYSLNSGSRWGGCYLAWDLTDFAGWASAMGLTMRSFAM